MMQYNFSNTKLLITSLFFVAMSPLFSQGIFISDVELQEGKGKLFSAINLDDAVEDYDSLITLFAYDRFDNGKTVFIGLERSVWGYYYSLIILDENNKVIGNRSVYSPLGECSLNWPDLTFVNISNFK